MTNGEKLCIDFPNMRYTISGHRVITTIGVAASFDLDWWNAEYKESTTKNDLGVREFEEIVVEYPPEDLCTYPEYKGKPYFSIKYKEGNDCFIGYGTYNPKVFSRYLRDHFMPSITPQEPRWILDSKRLPESGGNYLITYCYQNKIETQEAVYSIDEDEAKWFDITGVEITLAVIAWMPLPKPYIEVER